MKNVIQKTGVGTTINPSDIHAISLEVQSILKNRRELDRLHESAVLASKMAILSSEMAILTSKIAIFL